MQAQGQSYDPVDHEGPEVLAEDGLAEQRLAYLRRHDEHRVEQDRAEYGVSYAGLRRGGSSYEECRHGEHAYLGVGVVGVQRAHVLQVDYLPPGGQHGRDHRGDYPGPVDVYAGDLRSVLALSDRAEVLSQLGLHYQHGEDAQSDDYDPRDHGHLAHDHQRRLGHHRVDRQAGQREAEAGVDREGGGAVPVAVPPPLVKVVPDEEDRQQRHCDYQQRVDEVDLVDRVERVLHAALLDRDEVDGHAYAHSVRLDQGVGGGDWEDHSDYEQEQELVDAVGEVADYQGGDHLLAARLVVQQPGQVAAQGRHESRHGEAEEQAGHAAHVVVARQRHGDLPRHGAYDYAEVEAEPG